jgi:hypothetical protein
MTQEDIISMAREAGIPIEIDWAGRPSILVIKDGGTYLRGIDDLERFAALVAAAQREKVAHWMRNLGYATGHGDTMEDLLDHLGTQISEGLEAEVLMEREACAKVCDEHASVEGIAQRCAEQIRARGKT